MVCDIYEKYQNFKCMAFDSCFDERISMDKVDSVITLHFRVWQVIQAVNPKCQNLDVVSWKLPDKLISARILGLAIQLCQ